MGEPQIHALPLSLSQAQAEHRCRICGRKVFDETFEDQMAVDRLRNNLPPDWHTLYESIYYPLELVLRCGDEFAHPACLRSATGSDSLDESA